MRVQDFAILISIAWLYTSSDFCCLNIDLFTLYEFRLLLTVLLLPKVLDSLSLVSWTFNSQFLQGLKRYFLRPSKIVLLLVLHIDNINWRFGTKSSAHILNRYWFSNYSFSRPMLLKAIFLIFSEVIYMKWQLTPHPIFLNLRNRFPIHWFYTRQSKTINFDICVESKHSNDKKLNKITKQNLTKMNNIREVLWLIFRCHGFKV